MKFILTAFTGGGPMASLNIIRKNRSGRSVVILRPYSGSSTLRL